MSKPADAKPWRSKHLIQEVAEDRKSPQPCGELDPLLEEGRVQRPRGCFQMTKCVLGSLGGG